MDMESLEVDLERIASLVVLRYICLAATVLYVYDFFLTLPLEVEIVWGFKLTKNMVLLLLNRYLTLFAGIPIVALLFHPHGKFDIEIYESSLSNPCAEGIDSCQVSFYRLFPRHSECRQPGDYHVVIRILAVYGYSFRVACAVVPFATITVALSAWSFSQLDTSLRVGHGPFHACFPFLQKFHQFIAAWSCYTAFFALTFTLMVIKLYRMRLEHPTDLSDEPSLAVKLMQHVAQYFGFVMVNSFCNLMLFTVQTHPFLHEASGRNSDVLLSISSMLLSRMVFNVKKEGLDIDGEGTVSQVEFRSRAPEQTIHIFHDSLMQTEGLDDR
ncbi:hypothetical protein SCHPADRAFT_674495 [Schizopora paradoxa]|uniref:DUF6533 domain-containing protein n=1 Tax=Schizopora paradoxa TaxID=27342 RepID=A0A0H2RQ47_9AGAM|nr:hypothetical protein SCHPADRAFT_674495 [Schizopora paradoxa]